MLGSSLAQEASPEAGGEGGGLPPIPAGAVVVAQGLWKPGDFSGEMPAPGAVMRVNADGSVETVVDGLFFPHGIAFDAAGNLFVAVNSIISDPSAPLGQVLRIDGIAHVM